MRKLLLFVVAGFAMLCSQAYAQPCVTFAANCPPPAGAFLDLAVPNSDGSGNTTLIPHSYANYSADFLAGTASTNLTFAFREDPAFISLSNIVLTDVTHPSGNLLLNGDFSLGTYGTNAPTDWTYLNQYGASYGGVLDPGCGETGNNCYYDGAVGAYDAITQVIATNPGDIYSVSFWVTDNSGYSNFSDLGTGSAAGIDLLVYAGVGAPQRGTIPEPASLALLGVGVIALGASRRLRKQA